jgi:acyl CoA:acetate/3-ketoacid CoA transferase alpha subunit
MNATITGQQLYPVSRTASMSTARLRSILAFAQVDAADTAGNVLYFGMDRAETQATAERTVADVSAELRRRVAE